MHFKPLNQAAMTEICICKTKWYRQDKEEKEQPQMVIVQMVVI